MSSPVAGTLTVPRTRWVSQSWPRLVPTNMTAAPATPKRSWARTSPAVSPSQLGRAGNQTAMTTRPKGSRRILASSRIQARLSVMRVRTSSGCSACKDILGTIPLPSPDREEGGVGVPGEGILWASPDREEGGVGVPGEGILWASPDREEGGVGVPGEGILWASPDREEGRVG